MFSGGKEGDRGMKWVIEINLCKFTKCYSLEVLLAFAEKSLSRLLTKKYRSKNKHFPDFSNNAQKLTF